jgi:PBSX family phage portal protein
VTDKVRIAKLAEDEELPVIEYVKTLGTRVISEGNSDPFSKSAEEIKTYSGTDAVFKRRVSNQIKKYQRGIDDAETKQIHEKQFYTGYDAFDVVEPPYNLEHLAKLYEISEPHHAAVDAKVANIVGLGYKFVENSKSKRNLERIAEDDKKTKKVRRSLDEHREELNQLLDDFNEEDGFTETLIKVWRDYETTGNGYLEIGRKKDGTIGYIGHIPSQTLRIRRKRDGFVQVSGFEVQFFAHFGHSKDPNPIGGGRPNEVIHMKRYSPTSGFYGVPDIVAAKQAIAGNEFAQRFNLDYFENKAVPRHVIILKGAKLGTQAESALLSFFETSLKGQNHRSLYIPLPGDTLDNKVELKIEAIEAGIQDSSFGKYRQANLADILMVHRVPITKISVSDAASLSIAKDADKTFKEQVCAPEQRIFEKKLNKVTKELTDAFELKLNEMTLTDENTQSQIDERRRKTGVETANEQRARRGDPAVEGGDELFDMNGSAKAAQQRNEITAQRQRESERSANATDSAGESRNPKGEGRTTP